ncbi:MAG TPA: PsbP-related protein [Candidatus Saccharimonadales bacterium]|jgi:hypothetical protein
MATADKHSGANQVPEHEADDYEAASHSTADYAKFMPELRPKKKWPRVVGWTLLGIVILAALGAGGYWLANRKPAPKPAQSQQNANSQTSNKITTTTKPYTSNDLNLSFNYPENWTVADTGNGKLTVTSPAMQLTDASGQTQTGKVVMTIQNENSADFSAFKAGNAVAVMTSEKVAYTNPASDQRADTYISFLQYAATTTNGALDGVYITGNAGYQKGQAIPEVDIAKVDPVVTVTFAKCANASCTGNATPLSVSSEMWSNSGFSAPIETMLKSLAIQ